jgi:phosphomannomutase
MLTHPFIFLNNMADISSKQLMVFDLDGTLAESKSSMDQEMSGLLTDLLQKKNVAVIGGGSWTMFQKQLLAGLTCPSELLSRLYLFPNTSTRFYRWQDNTWTEVYSQLMSPAEKDKIFTAFAKMFTDIGYTHPAKIYGELIEDRGTQISFSIYGQDIVEALGPEGVRIKKEWLAKNEPLKLKMRDVLQELLPEFEVRAAGLTTIDVTHKGIDKAYGIRQIEKLLNIPIADMVFVGDALFKGGNDYPAISAGVECFAISGPDETKSLIKSWLDQLA